MEKQELINRIAKLEAENSRLQEELTEVQEELESYQPDWYPLMPVLSKKDIDEYYQQDRFRRLTNSIKHEWVKVRLNGEEIQVGEIWIRGMNDIVLTPANDPHFIKTQLIESIASSCCEAQLGQFYRLPDGSEVQYDELQGWLLERGVDIKSAEWSNWLDMIDGYYHCETAPEMFPDMDDADYEDRLNDLFEDEDDDN